MTFYEAAIEVLRKQGAPLHYRRITEVALEENLLSHVGRVPEETMQARLMAMTRRGDGRQVVVVEPGVFALAEWGADHDAEAAEATEPKPKEEGPPLRPRERAPLTFQESKAIREAERSGRFESEDRDARQRSRRRRRRPKAEESAADALTAILVELGGGPIDAQYVVDALPGQSELPEGFPTTLEEIVALATAENARRAEAGQPPAFVVEGDRLDLVPAEPVVEEPAAPAAAVRPTRRESAVAEAAAALASELRKAAPEVLEQLVRTLGDHFGVGDVKVAKRSAKGSPLFTAFVRLGVGQLRVAVRVLVSGRDVRPDDVDEVRADLEHYSAAGGVVITSGRVDRAARARGEDMSLKPVVLLDGDRLAAACIEAGIGVRVRLEETVEFDPNALRTLGADR